MKRLLWYVSCCCTLSLIGAAAANASPKESTTTTGTAASLGRVVSDENQFTSNVTAAPEFLAQTPPPPPAPTDTPTTPTTPTAPTDPTTPTTPTTGSETEEIQRELNTIQENRPQDRPTTASEYNPKTSPQFAIFNPVGFGADRNLFFISGSFQSSVRLNNPTSDGEAGFGVGLGNAVDSVGLEIAYSLNSFGRSAGFGSGAFSAKLHKRVAEDTSVAIGWNQFAQITLGSGSGSDYPKNSYYLAATKIFRTTDDINAPFSRVAATAGVGGGVFLPFDATTLDRSGLGVFGSLGFRVARPVSAVVEWTGQDLAAGISVAPFDNFPLVITPAFRDLTGVSGQNPRFVLGASVAFNF
jgi:hypothetical protein